MIQRFANKIYPHAPVSIQNMWVSLYGYRWKKRRFGGKFKSFYTDFKEREKYSNLLWQSFVNTELQRLITHAFHYVPFYRSMFHNLNLTEKSLKSISINDLVKFPFLEKEHLRKYGTSALLSRKLESCGEFYSSSGSTGTPTKILFSELMHQKWTAAYESRIRNWAGLTFKDGRGMIGGRRVVREYQGKGPFYRYNYFENQVYFSAYHINKNNAADYVAGINKHKPAYMTGYAMSNFILARFIEDLNLKVSPLKAIITSSEKLTHEMREMFKRVYGCRTYDSYSGVEACSLISECEYGNLHVSQDVGYIEFIKADGSYAQAGESGEMVCTGFLNYDQPLIRYRIGDVAKLSYNQSCECGRNMPIVDEIIGRTEDVIIGEDGRQMVRFHGIFIDIPSIVEGQIIQYTQDQFEIKVVLDKPLSFKEKESIYERMQSQLGHVKIKITPVDFIERSSSGKFKAVISHVVKS
jgi:phenylacetate-CoA ligase